MGGFADQLLADLAVSGNIDSLLTEVSADAFCARSFSRRYGRDGYNISAATIGATAAGAFEMPVYAVERWSGTRDRRGDNCERWALSLRRALLTEAGWIDVLTTAVVAVTFTAFALTGASVANPAITNPTASGHALGFSLPTSGLDSQTVSYPLDIYLFAAETVDAVDDMRRIATVRHALGFDPQVLQSFDDSMDRRTQMFVQIYPTGASTGTVSQANLAALFEAADVLLAFSSAGGAPA